MKEHHAASASCKSGQQQILRPKAAGLAAVGSIVLLALTGCQAPVAAPALPAEFLSSKTEPVTVLEGDVLKVSFPGAPNLDTTQQVRRDGKIALSLVGEVSVVGKTPAQLEAELAELYSSQLVSKEVTVTVVSSTFPVYVTGAVVRPGKVMSDRPLTALEAVMEAGGFDYQRANLQNVIVIRHEGGEARQYALNLKLVLEGKQTQAFYLKPSDIVYVPERFSWF